MTDEHMKQIEKEIREWSRRPGMRTPEMARSRVMAHLGDRKPGRSSWNLAFAAVAIAGLGIGLLLTGTEDRLPSEEVRAVESSSQAMLVYELDTGSKLYLDLVSQP